MPGFDRTGPEGKGSMTGRRLGQCSQGVSPEADNGDEERAPQRGRRFLRGFGWGRHPEGEAGYGRSHASGGGFGRGSGYPRGGGYRRGGRGRHRGA